jgi:hypothetical protein
MDYGYREELTDDERLEEEMLANLQQGNHKSAQDKSDQVAKLLKKESTMVLHGSSPKHLVPLIPGSMVQSLGLPSSGRSMKPRADKSQNINSL